MTPRRIIACIIFETTEPQLQDLLDYMTSVLPHTRPIYITRAFNGEFLKVLRIKPYHPPIRDKTKNAYK